MRRLLLAALLLASACATRQPAPVVDRVPIPAPPPPVVQPPPPPVAEKPPEKPIPTHTVKRGETLAAIALQYGLDYRDLAAWNGIANRNALSVGQVLVLAPPAGMAAPGTPVATPLTPIGPPIEARPLANTQLAKVEPRGQKLPFSERTLGQLSSPDPNAPPVAVAPTPPVEAAPPVEKPAGTANEDVDWMWPAKGKVLAAFTDASKGMDIAGRKGAPVVAAASGRVIYANELRGYGKLVIVKHNDTWISAYGHNDNILVKEQQEVRKGQKIAEMGQSDTDQVKLHFEVRRQGRPVDPQKVLPPS